MEGVVVHSGWKIAFCERVRTDVWSIVMTPFEGSLKGVQFRRAELLVAEGRSQICRRGRSFSNCITPRQPNKRALLSSIWERHTEMYISSQRSKVVFEGAVLYLSSPPETQAEHQQVLRNIRRWSHTPILKHQRSSAGIEEAIRLSARYGISSQSHRWPRYTLTVIQAQRNDLTQHIHGHRTVKIHHDC